MSEIVRTRLSAEPRPAEGGVRPCADFTPGIRACPIGCTPSTMPLRQKLAKGILLEIACMKDRREHAAACASSDSRNLRSVTALLARVSAPLPPARPVFFFSQIAMISPPSLEPSMPSTQPCSPSPRVETRPYRAASPEKAYPTRKKESEVSTSRSYSYMCALFLAGACFES